jgi:hypothetical protein
VADQKARWVKVSSGRGCIESEMDSNAYEPWENSRSIGFSPSDTVYSVQDAEIVCPRGWDYV